MKIRFCLALGTLGILFSSCQQEKKEGQVVSQRFIHKYGYAVGKEEWESRNYPGQIITTLRNGVTLTATYENGILHGSSTTTYPHSQTVESYRVYNQGEQVKEILYDIQGMPLRETLKLSPSRTSVTLWYADGSPMSVEEYVNEELLEGQYFTLNNETEARVEKGNGQRIRRNREGMILSKDEIEGGYMAKQESFFSNGYPESILFYSKGQLHGEKKTFSTTGEPLSVEEWVHGSLHGKSTYFKNGCKSLEVSYLYGGKNGLEIHYLDGEKISQEIQWENDKKHGSSTYYVEGIPHIQWYYDGKLVSKRKFDEMSHLDEMISKISPDLEAPSHR